MDKYWKELGFIEFYAIGAFVKDKLVKKYICINNLCDVEAPKMVREVLNIREVDKPSPVIDRIYTEEGDFKTVRIIMNSEGLEIVEEKTFYVYEYLLNGLMLQHRDVRMYPSMPWRRVSRPKGFMKIKGEVILDSFATAAVVYKLFRMIADGVKVEVDKKLRIVDEPSADPWGEISYDDRGFRAEGKVLVEGGEVRREFKGMLRRGFGEIKPTPRSLYLVPDNDNIEGRRIITYANGKFYLWDDGDGPYETEVSVSALRHVESVGANVLFERFIDRRGVPFSVGAPPVKVVIE